MTNDPHNRRQISKLTKENELKLIKLPIIYPHINNITNHEIDFLLQGQTQRLTEQEVQKQHKKYTDNMAMYSQ